MLRALLISLLGLFTVPLGAMPFKCDKAQTNCEVQTKRMTIGDRVGVFNDDKQLVAIGQVTEIRANSRIVKISKKWGSLYRSYEMEIIPDQNAENPEQHYKILTPLPELVWGAQLGIYSLGVGDGFIGPHVDGLVRWWWLRNLYVVGRLHYLSGSGEASDNLGAVGTKSVKLSSYGLSGGLSELLAVHEKFAIRFEGDLGFSNTSVDLGGDFNVEQVLNDRVSDGMGIFARLGASAVWRRVGFEPEVGFSYLRLHSSNNYGLFIGVNGPI